MAKSKKMLKSLRLLFLLCFTSFVFAQNHDKFNIPASVMPKNWGHFSEKNKSFPKNPGIFDKSSAARIYDDADPSKIKFIYADIISKKNSREVGAIHFQYLSDENAETESKKMKDDGTSRMVYLKNGSLISTIFCDSESDREVVDKVAGYFEKSLNMERFFPEIELTPVDTAVAASAYEDNGDYTVTEAVMDTAMVVTSFKFDQYFVKTTVQKQNVPINWKSNNSAQKFQKQIEMAIQTTEPNFANFYTLTFVEKNSNYLGFMIDSRTGTIYETPSSCIEPERGSNFEKDSRLFVTSICVTEVRIDSTPYDGYEWDEKGKTFKKLKKPNQYIND